MVEGSDKYREHELNISEPVSGLPHRPSTPAPLDSATYDVHVHTTNISRQE